MKIRGGKITWVVPLLQVFLSTGAAELYGSAPIVTQFKIQVRFGGLNVKRIL
jgi:hypothetical protein